MRDLEVAAFEAMDDSLIEVADILRVRRSVNMRDLNLYVALKHWGGSLVQIADFAWEALIFIVVVFLYHLCITDHRNIVIFPLLATYFRRGVRGD